MKPDTTECSVLIVHTPLTRVAQSSDVYRAILARSDEIHIGAPVATCIYTYYAVNSIYLDYINARFTSLVFHVCIFSSCPPSVVQRVCLASTRLLWTPRSLAGGARINGKYMAEDVCPYIVNSIAGQRLEGRSFSFEIQCYIEEADAHLAKSNDLIAARIPWAVLIPKLTGLQLRHVAKLHRTNVSTRWNVPLILAGLKEHVCTDCVSLVCIMRLMPGKVVSKTPTQSKSSQKDKPRKTSLPDVQPSAALTAKRQRDIADQARLLRFQRKLLTNRLVDTEFPPNPLKMKEIHRMLTNIGRDMLPESFQENGCAVCGLLTPQVELSPLKQHEHLLKFLCPSVSGITRRERFDEADPVEELEGPILADGCEYMCVRCEASLLQWTIPHNALVNNQWLGKVPDALKDLRYAEQVMIARVRHNRCVMRVNSGRVRMHANAILFAQPAVKVYLKLPPSRLELAEVLAFVFTGSAAPTQEDFDRTPMLVRRDKVATALEWLKLNHQDYADLEISSENLLSYKLRDIPVVVDYRHSNEKPDDSIPVEARSVFDNNEEHGTSSGQCSFAVHGLTSAEYSTASMSFLKAVALQHLTSDGKMLGIGRAAEPESIYKNPALYPSMFPWLFPYGKGGIGHPTHKHIISDMSRKGQLLLYFDKRFQTDTYFPMIAFNHEQMKGSSVGSRVLTSRSNFDTIAARLRRIDYNIAGAIADRMRNGELVRPESSQEKDCFNLMHDLDTIGAHVMGFATSKKHMRNEIWSVSAFINAPSWFLTMSWNDASHPLALYYAEHDTVYRPELKSSDERTRLMAQNPVAAARFFHYMVNVFLKDILCWNREERGLFGHTDAYYGTVEQQGRLTLHLHMLVWVKNSMSPQEIREKMMAPDSDFVKRMIAYLESSSQGHFNKGTLDEVREVVSKKSKGTVDAIPESSAYTTPTQTLPSVPPPLCDESPRCDESCEKCRTVFVWLSDLEDEVDDILLRSNIHSCSQSVPDAEYEDAKKDWRNKKKAGKLKGFSHERRGCLSSAGVCKARFPRELFDHSFVDDDGHLNLKHLEPFLNKISFIITYFSRSNTDLSSLLSGTSVKAVISYVSDYISKIGLKSYQAFASVFDVFQREQEHDSVASEGSEASRTLMRQMINSMSSKMELGSPMASLYLLGNPDHYSSHVFVNFFWKTYVLHVRRWWLFKSYDGPADSVALPEEMVSIQRREGELVASSVIDDYKHRPTAFQTMSLYEWTQCHFKKARTKKERQTFEEELIETERLLNDGPSTDNDSDGTSCALSDFISDDEQSCDESQRADSEYSEIFEWDDNDPDDVILDMETKKKADSNVRWYPFQQEHPHFKTHKCRCDFSRVHHIIPNFIGGAVPRSDKGDREFYCLTILTLFKSWRQPDDLKDALSTWDQTFAEHAFTQRERELINNFNMRYECNDARDDHYAAMKKKTAEAEFGFTTHFDNPVMGRKDKLTNHMEYEAEPDDDNDLPDIESLAIGKRMSKILKDSEEMRQTLQSCKWLNKTTDGLLPLPISSLTVPYKTRSIWTKVVKEARKVFLTNKLADMPDADRVNRNGQFKPNTVEILSADYFMPKVAPSSDMTTDIIHITMDKFRLNEEQTRAFRIVADHAVSGTSKQNPLKMYLAGMGGTGKSNVFKAIMHFFKLRKEDYRYIVVGPTGSVAALLLGSTYHSVFKVPRDAHTKSKNQDDIEGTQNETNMLAGVNERIQGVEYILLDEVSMVSCNDLQTLSCQAAKARNLHDVEFGGLSVILAGDFAQLPPTTGPPLYDGKVGVRTSSAASLYSQNATLGKILWHQFNTVVVLRQNMRQSSQTPEDAKLRTCLENMRYAACTPEDIEFLRSRIASDRPGHPRLDSKEFRNVSIITSWNVHKDVINDLGAVRFAQDTAQKLTHFYSSDSLNSRQPDKKRWKQCEQSFFKRIGPNLQQTLWAASPACTNDHIPGRLSLCVGMPVMLRSNDATELCITKGQEGIVRGWNDSIGSHGQRVLETLFVELINPAREVQLPDLPKNVIPLARKSSDITCLLPDDNILTISREQCLVLLNFAMTDYASQGKSREKNCVHLNYCKNHMSIYVALSRGYTAKNTVILQAFDTGKITKGISGYLRQEFREIEILDEITRLRFEGKLPREVSGVYRGQLLHAFRQWNKNKPDPDHMHPAIRFDPALDSTDATRPEYDHWHGNSGDTSNQKGDVRRKRKTVDMIDDQQPNKRAKLSATQQLTVPYDPASEVLDDVSTPQRKIQGSHNRSARGWPQFSPGAYLASPTGNIVQPNSHLNRNVLTSQNTAYDGPIGLIWDACNYSCGYDSLFTPLLDACKRDWGYWSAIFSGCSPPLHLWASLMGDGRSPETARNSVRERLHAMEPENFPMGPRLLYIDNLLMAISNRTPYGVATTFCERCAYVEDHDTDTFLMFMTIYRTDSIVAMHPDGLSTTEWLLNHLHGLTSTRCPYCSVPHNRVRLRRQTRINDVPPLIVLGISYTHLDVEYELVLNINENAIIWRLKGLIYHSAADRHFVCIVIDDAGRAWFHDGIATGRRTNLLGRFSSLSREDVHKRGAYTLCAALYLRS